MPYHTIITVPLLSYLLSLTAAKLQLIGSISAFSIYRNRRKSLFLRKKSSSFLENKMKRSPFFFCSALLCNFMFSCPHFPLKCLRYYHPHTNSCILKSLSTSNQYSPLHTSVVVPPQSNDSCILSEVRIPFFFVLGFTKNPRSNSASTTCCT